MSYEIQTVHSLGEQFHFRRTLIAIHTIRENPCNPWLENLPSKTPTADSRIKMGGTLPPLVDFPVYFGKKPWGGSWGILGFPRRAGKRVYVAADGRLVQ